MITVKSRTRQQGKEDDPVNMFSQRIGIVLMERIKRHFIHDRIGTINNSR